MTGIRIDKWLWAARFFKTRALASQACALGRVLSNGQTAKPSREIKVGDHLRITNPAGEFYVDVLAISQMRGPAEVAQTLYLETETSWEARLKLAAERKALAQLDLAPTHRPSKRDRRLIHGFRDRHRE